MSVFGIQIGAPFKLPDCPDTNTSTSSTCRVFERSNSPSTMLTTAARAVDDIASDRIHDVQGPWTNEPVNLAKDRRPDWASQAVSVVVMDGIALGLNFKVAGDATAIDAHLIEKYHEPPQMDGESRCVNKNTGVVTASAKNRVWTLPGLRVYYDPISQGVNCSTGNIYLESDTLHDLKVRIAQRRESRQPKM